MKSKFLQKVFVTLARSGKRYCSRGPYLKIKKMRGPHKILGSNIVLRKFDKRFPES